MTVFLREGDSEREHIPKFVAGVEQSRAHIADVRLVSARMYVYTVPVTVLNSPTNTTAKAYRKAAKAVCALAHP